MADTSWARGGRTRRKDKYFRESLQEGHSEDLARKEEKDELNEIGGFARGRHKLGQGREDQEEG